MGHSAGGHLALWTAARGGAALTRGVVALAPVADLARAYRLRLGDDAVRLLLGGGPEDVPERYAAADPAALLPLGVPLAVVHGHLDQQVPYPVGADFAAAARLAGDDARLVELPDAEHFALIDPLSPAWPAVLDALDLLA
jgi:dipeptidyl aminopeptidase/acylaminoacyl peptidase